MAQNYVSVARFSWSGHLLLKLDPKSLSNSKPLYVLLKNDSSDPILWGKQDDIAFKSLKKGLINLSVLWRLNSQILLLLFVHEKEGDVFV